jgi:hypothetical protein
LHANLASLPQLDYLGSSSWITGGKYSFHFHFNISLDSWYTTTWSTNRLLDFIRSDMVGSSIHSASHVLAWFEINKISWWIAYPFHWLRFTGQLLSCLIPTYCLSTLFEFAHRRRFTVFRVAVVSAISYILVAILHRLRRNPWMLTPSASSTPLSPILWLLVDGLVMLILINSHLH